MEFIFLDLKSPSSFLFKPSFVDFWLVCIKLIISAFIYPENCCCAWLKIVSGPYPKQTHRFASPTGLWKVVERVPVFMISPVAINILIGLEAVTQIWIVLVYCWKLICKNHRRLFLLLGLYIYKYYRRLFLLLGLYIF